MPVFAALLLCISASASAAGAASVGIDTIINAELSRKGITPSQTADPATLVRRYYLVLTDKLPSGTQVLTFLKNQDRERLVDSLLASDGFSRKMVLKWGDLLRIKSEFPSCMWPNAVQALNKWLFDEFRAGTPYNEFAFSLLTGTGSNFRVPQTNFFRAGSDRTPHKFASDAALLFLGRRDAPEEWNCFFSQVKFKSTKEWKEEILCLDADVLPPDAPVTLGTSGIVLEAGSDYRIPFANWLTGSREFASAFADRLWYWLMGRGIAHPADDLDGSAVNSNPVLLDYLTGRFIESGYDIRALAREILLSDAFSRSSLTDVDGNCGDELFSHYIQSRLTAEQICDGICDITETSDKYSSRAPEPFTNFPEGTRAIDVCDGTITTPQLDIFGKPSRDVALESGRDNSVNAKQILYLLNSTDIQAKLKASPYIDRISESGDIHKITESVYLRVLSRPASEAEKRTVSQWFSVEKTSGATIRDAAESLVWALLNTDEFLFLN